MTAIIGIVTDDGATYLGCDGKLIQGDVGQSIAYPKVFIREIEKAGLLIPIGFGLAGSPFIWNDVRYRLEMPEYVGRTCEMESADVDRYIFGSLIPCMSERYYDMQREFGGVIAMAGHLYSIDRAFNATRSINPYETVGSGMEVALGALVAARMLCNGSVEKSHLEIALRAVSEILSSCNGDISEIEVEQPSFKNGARLQVRADIYDGRDGW